jgi:nucleotide-binding universal stress UspA family protein
MDRFKSILVVASPGHLEPLTLRAAVELADANGAHITVFDVVTPLPSWRKKMNVDGQVIDIEGAMLRDRQERLTQMVENTRGGPDTEVIVTLGEPFIEVIRRVLTDAHDLVIVGEPAIENSDSPTLSSGVMHLVRKCPVPVWVMRPSQAHNLKVLALVDPDPGDPVRNGLNELVMELAASLARREGGELHIGHAWVLEGEAALRSSPYVRLPGSMVDVMVRSTEATSLDQVDELARRHVPESERSIHMIAGAPGTVLPRLADRLDIGVIVMGTVGRTGLRGLIMGNTAETILRSVRCSVLALKPEGFKTPVKPQKASRKTSKELT